MPGWLAEALSVCLLGGVLVAAVIRPRRLPEAVVAVPAAGLLIATGSLSLSDARHETHQLLPVVWFLVAVLVLAWLCDREGVFTYAGGVLARGSKGRSGRLLVLTFVIAAVTTAVLSLDATVVLLTPVVLATATGLRRRARPYVYACGHLANTGSLLLPVSNLTNLLAFAATGLTFGRFAALMALPWLAGIAVEYAVLRLFFRGDLTADAETTQRDVDARPPVFALVVVAVTLGGFVVSSAYGVGPEWAATGGALVLAARAMTTGRGNLAGVVRAADLPFALFVLALGIIVVTVERHGLGGLVRGVVPHGSSFPVLLAVAALAAVLANVVNNLPATLLTVAALPAAGPAVLLAVLIGVGVGPNLTYVGSLANLLWRRALRGAGSDPGVARFHVLGLLTVPVALTACTVALWASVRLIGVR